ncbi:hypothetical protein [Photorhabdus bodei]|uniref:Uncharacterized protein n=1 Tax=Photorhabdus bodei TaxID=2029681 RepID=A0ABX0AWJ6_9GAMM|nr:hypothetical protein [Photorhabdus bodei]NDL00769.1 hypothetical protein [Photorhabdus bodei]NDL04935.1 hypothetical protein [Photorhabdus bodei]NDL09268.1 hypothetical protein [Photorhabdus bodei]
MTGKNTLWPINLCGSIHIIYTQWISRCIATARERIPGSIDNYVTGVSECRQQRGNLKDNGYNLITTSTGLACSIQTYCVMS